MGLKSAGRIFFGQCHPDQRKIYEAHTTETILSFPMYITYCVAAAGSLASKETF